VTASLYIGRGTVNIRSGAGEMIANQADFFSRQQYSVTVCCNRLSRGTRGAFDNATIRHQSWLSRALTSKTRQESRLIDTIRNLRDKHPGTLIDHGLRLGSADISYVHNFLAPEYKDHIEGYMSRQEPLERFWKETPDQHLIIANSMLVKRGLLESCGLPEARVEVIYPGYDPLRFNLDSCKSLRPVTRRQLGIGDETKLVGLVTSGDFHKRGLDRFLDCIEQLKQMIPGLKGLVLGGRKCPEVLKSHRLLRSGEVFYQPSTFFPEKYFAALDVLLYPARYEEFGIVILEAMAMGLPVVTSTATGASEILASASARCVVGTSAEDIDSLCKRTRQLLQLTGQERSDLGKVLSQEAVRHTHEIHNEQLGRWVKRFSKEN